jgi:hypothetical protein
VFSYQYEPDTIPADGRADPRRTNPAISAESGLQPRAGIWQVNVRWQMEETFERPYDRNNEPPYLAGQRPMR